MSDRFDLNRLNRDPQLVACAALADDLFSFINRQVSVPASCAALVYAGAGHPRVVGAGRTVDSGDVRELFFVRTVPFELEYRFDGLPSQDGHEFAARVKLSVQPVPERTELEAFRRTVLGSQREVRQARLRQHCEQAVRAAVAAFAKSHTAKDLIAPERWDDFDDVLAEHFKPVGFESGLALGPDPDVVLESAAFEMAQHEEQVAARRAEHQAEEQLQREAAAKARKQHLAELTEMVEKVKAMAADGDGFSVPELIKTFDSSQRGRLYQGLMALEEPTRRTRALLVVAGGELLWFDPLEPQRPTRRLKLPKDAGPLRSVRLAGEGENARILVGARLGVHLLNEQDDDINTYVFIDRPEIRGGVNAAALLRDHLYATHSEVGLVQWRVGDTAKHALCLTEFTEGSKAVRDVQADAAGRLWLSVDDLLIGWTPGRDDSQTAMQAPAEVTTMLVADGHVTAGLRDGTVVRWLIGDTGRMETVRGATGTPVRSIAWLSGGGVPRLLIGDGRPHLDLHVLGDSYHGEYRCLQNLRWGFAGEDVIVGVNDRRDHLFVWQVDDPTTPAASVAVGRLTGRSVQDVVLL